MLTLLLRSLQPNGRNTYNNDCTQASEGFAPASQGACTQGCASQVSGHIHPVTPQARDPLGKPPWSTHQSVHQDFIPAPQPGARLRKSAKHYHKKGVSEGPLA